MRLGIAVPGDEGLEVALGDAHRGAEVVRDEFTALDPAAHRAGRDLQASATSAMVKNRIGPREIDDLISTALSFDV